MQPRKRKKMTSRRRGNHDGVPSSPNQHFNSPSSTSSTPTTHRATPPQPNPRPSPQANAQSPNANHARRAPQVQPRTTDASQFWQLRQLPRADASAAISGASEF